MLQLSIQTTPVPYLINAQSAVTIIAHLSLLPKHKLMNRVRKWCVDMCRNTQGIKCTTMYFICLKSTGVGYYLTPWNVPYKQVAYKVLTSSVVAISPRQHPMPTKLNGHNFNIIMFGVNTSPSLFRIQPAHNEYIINIHVHVLLYKSRFLSLILTHILTVPFSLQMLTQTFRCNYCMRTTST